MPIKLFRRLLHGIPAVESDLRQKVDAVGRRGAKRWQMILNSLRRLCDGLSYQALDDQCRMSAESQRREFKRLFVLFRSCYGSEFLNRPPTLSELRALDAGFAGTLFPGCVGSVDCMNIVWKNCPRALKGQYHNPKNGNLATIAVEAMCDTDLYFWHVYCGIPGTKNYIMVSETSPLFLDILSGTRRMNLP